MEKVGCPCPLQSSFLVLLGLLHLHKGCTMDQRLKNDPSNPNLQIAITSHVCPVPSKKQGLYDRDFAQFYHTEVWMCKKYKHPPHLPCSSAHWNLSWLVISHLLWMLLSGLLFPRKAVSSIWHLQCRKQCSQVQEKATGLHQHQREVSSSHPWDLPTQAPVPPDSLENFNCCTGFCFSLWNPSLY